MAPDLTSLQGIFSSFLNNGTVFSDEYNELCCPDCLQTIFPPTTFPKDENLLTTPIQPLNGSEFKVYVFCNSAGFNYFMDILSVTSGDLNCCLHVNGSVSSISSINISEDIPNQFKSCSNNFNSCINQLKNSLTPTDIEVISNEGIVEYGSISGQSQVCLIKEFVDYAYDNRDNPSITKGDILLTILKDGIVIACYLNEMSISNLQTFEQWYQNYITPPVPA